MKTIQIAGFVKASYQPDIRQVTVSTITVNKEMQDYSKPVRYAVNLFQNPREHSHQTAHHKEG